MSKYFFKHRMLCIATIISFIFVGVSHVSIGFFITYITNLVMVNDNVNLTYIIWQSIGFVLLLAGGDIAKRTFGYHYTTRTRFALEEEFAKKLLIKNRSLSDVQNIFNQEIWLVISEFMFKIFQATYAAVAFLVAVIYSFYLSWQITLIVLVLGLIVVLVNHKFFSKRLADAEDERQLKNVMVNKALNGFFSCTKTISIFFAQSFAVRKLNEQFESRRITNVKYGRVIMELNVINQVLNLLIQFVPIVAGFLLAVNGSLTMPQVIGYVAITQFLASPFSQILDFKSSFDSTKPIRKKLTDILDEKVDISIRDLGEHDITLNKVSFSYTDDEFMSDLQMTFSPNKKYLILGESGSGKSTLLKLILRDLLPVAGSITYDNTDINGLSNTTWYKNICYSGQSVEIIPGTLRENIVFGEICDDEKLYVIINSLNLGYLSDKFDVELNEDLSNFSGGELQRIAIARMLYKDSPIFIFDEFTSSLDSINAHNIEKEILSIDKKLVICVSHRINIDLMNEYDGILILENGKIKCNGSYADVQEDIKPFIVLA